MNGASLVIIEIVIINTFFPPFHQVTAADLPRTKTELKKIVQAEDPRITYFGILFNVIGQQQILLYRNDELCHVQYEN